MSMEMESSFLSDGKAAQRLLPILKQVIEDLNTKGTIIFIKLLVWSFFL